MRRLAVLASMVAALIVPASAPAGLPTLPLGKFSAKVKAPAALKGTWVLNFAKGGKYTISENGAVVVRGHFTSTARIYFSGETGPRACPQFGVYVWKNTGKTLTFKKVSDPCAGRAIVLGYAFKATA
jgi:hypothetical protein